MPDLGQKYRWPRPRSPLRPPPGSWRRCRRSRLWGWWWCRSKRRRDRAWTRLEAECPPWSPRPTFSRSRSSWLRREWSPKWDQSYDDVEDDEQSEYQIHDFRLISVVKSEFQEANHFIESPDAQARKVAEQQLQNPPTRTPAKHISYLQYQISNRAKFFVINSNEA